jgi:hypothetical protein
MMSGVISADEACASGDEKIHAARIIAMRQVSESAFTARGDAPSHSLICRGRMEMRENERGSRGQTAPAAIHRYHHPIRYLNQ